MNDYGVFADFYDELMSDVDYAALAEYYDVLIRENRENCGNGIPDCKTERGILLDLACGTGTLSVLMAERGWDVIGVDSSAEMLSKASKHDRLSYVRQDMTELDLFGTIDAAVCSLDGLNHLCSESELLETLKRVSLFMNVGGVFVFDVNTLYKHETTLGGNTFIKECGGLYCVWQNHYCGDGIIDIVLNIFAEKYGEYSGMYARYIEEITETAYDLDTITTLCEQAGFEVIEQREFPDADILDKVVFICRRVA
jgi:ubiquinone/menaquinone biosynthesis C-methylase UbiE